MSERKRPATGPSPGASQRTDPPAPRWHCRSAIETIAIAEVARDRGTLEAEHFSPAEQAALGSRPVQSLAGRLALKRALCQLLGAECSRGQLEPRDFIIGETPGGAPALGPLPTALSSGTASPLGRLFVSISHTKMQAVGLAVHERMLGDTDEHSRAECKGP